jgi:hypothetical protein
MALTLEANYSKKLGLPQYSSHQFSLTIRTELVDIKQVELETARLYSLLQSSVDREIQQVGFLPQNGEKASVSNGNGRHNGNGNGHQNGTSQASNSRGNGDIWGCTPKQKDLILKLVEDNHLDKSEIEQLAVDRFGCPVKALNKMQASNFIDELLSKYGKRDNTNRRNGKGVRA